MFPNSQLELEEKMSNRESNNTEKALSELEKLFLLDLIPKSAEEAREILKETGINIIELKHKGREIYKNILTEFDDDWRNIPEVTMEVATKKLLSKEIATSLRGKALSYLLMPLSFKEFLKFKKFRLEKNDFYLIDRYTKIKN